MRKIFLALLPAHKKALTGQYTAYVCVCIKVLAWPVNNSLLLAVLTILIMCIIVITATLMVDFPYLL